MKGIFSRCGYCWYYRWCCCCWWTCLIVFVIVVIVVVAVLVIVVDDVFAIDVVGGANEVFLLPLLLLLMLLLLLLFSVMFLKICFAIYFRLISNNKHEMLFQSFPTLYFMRKWKMNLKFFIQNFFQKFVNYRFLLPPTNLIWRNFVTENVTTHNLNEKNVKKKKLKPENFILILNNVITRKC